MNRATRALVWVALNAAMAYVAWRAAVNGVAWAGNLFKFATWVTFALEVIACAAAETERSRAEIAAGPPVPVNLCLAYDFALAGLLAANGWFGYATLTVLTGLFQVSFYRYRPATQEVEG